MRQVIGIDLSVSRIYWVFSFILSVGLLSCGNLGQLGWNASNLKVGANITPISSLNSKSKNNLTVYIQGKVEKQVPLLKQFAYQISDSTGKIWVITQQSDWQEGEQIVVKGKVHYKSIPLAGKEYGEVYLEEL